MNASRAPHLGILTALAAVALLAAACGSSTAPTAPPAGSPAAATAAPAATPAATPAAATASPAAAGSPGADPAAGLSIAAPYTLAPLEATQAAQFEASLKAGLGAMSSIVQVGAREVKKSGANAGLLLAMAFPGVPVPGSFLDSIAGGAAGSSGTVSSTKINGQDVKLIEGPNTHVAAYAHGGTIVFAYGQAAADATGIITAVIQATE
jgi:hypothetical protein